MKLLFINGVNLNMTGEREKSVYGGQTLAEINEEIKKHFPDDECEFFQSNIEGEICGKIQSAKCDGIILNAGAYTHYSYAIADALYSVNAKKIEVHMSNILARDEFRRKSVLAEKCDGAIMGFGSDVYFMAVDYLTWKK